MRKVFLLVGVSLVCLRGANAQGFDVASIRPQAPEDARFYIRLPAKGRFTAMGSTAKLLMIIAFDVQESQIAGGPGWLATEKWDIEARTDDGVEHSAEDTQRMLQNLLAQRFALRLHRATEQRPVYALTIAKGGPKFKVSDRERTNIGIAGKSMDIQRGSIAAITRILASALGRPVVDRTGLTELYDLSLKWDDAPIPEVLGREASAPGNESGVIFTAIQEQLGLRLEPQRAPVEVIVIDRIERPSGN
jgi:uncharacterized protein (TIGR03435 family)